MADMEAVVAVAISVLAVVFLGSLVALIVMCRQKYCRQSDLLSSHFNDNRPDIHLINTDNSTNVDLDDVRLHPNIERIIADEQWVDDATGIVPHCLAILKKCHNLTERLVAMTMSSVSHQSQKKLWEIIEVAKMISPRVDDVVRSMYPPLDARLLEARCSSLLLSVSHLALMMRFACHISKSPHWIDEALADMEEHLQVLRDAGYADDTEAQLMNGNIHTGQSGNTNIACSEEASISLQSHLPKPSTTEPV
ncbi:transmembrane protein 98-like isoform X2 [Limulus polyphemus]|uniref:Transmembrane protein 98 n=1 Tax=Limulus polyphemus TaxID=6850 RepID=A0ABM1SD69_LIMPO|nr:transmembrane protein 98-like isoform X2 [Limulus polyphemus]XP_022241572.1 transmembrane protein 98-like isoform X2 [Limulus polyphemus]XP_022241573.1 transmembrane protein 98-like isoform X2 [Limulus polyphemus]XP_022241574.1 transmembrane protein 98-like isoform X2 [Limulus polyphemus]XP_022241575.1 transmembrane protein 98-like isoform X2 [Limulus polyphemus]XP_022241576.1 transmembrane protein 98-like isoform X2 [Limulus polyphemus]XP_022241577.1 transmembrane protein 98-like isoform 